MNLSYIWQLDCLKRNEGNTLAEEKVKEEKAAKPKPTNKNGLTYAQTLEARAQRGAKTHQKNFAVKKAKKKEMEGK
ncbi:hypothetical protein IGK47_004787 [Enterococcus sp. AZ007]